MLFNDFKLTTKEELENISEYQISYERDMYEAINSKELYVGPCVYFIGNKLHKTVKIGKSNRLKTRLQQIKSQVPFELEVFRVIPCKTDTEAFKLENYLHRLYKEFNTNGEWFTLSNKIDTKYESLFVSEEAESIYNNLSKLEIEKALTLYSNDKAIQNNTLKNKKESINMHRLDILRAKYVKLLLPIIEEHWDNLEDKEDLSMINVEDLIKLALRLLDVGEKVVENILPPMFIHKHSKLVLESMFNIESIKIDKSKSGRPAEFIQYITSTTLLDNLSDKVLEIMDKVEITWLPHVVADFKGKLVYTHPTRKVIDGKILEANRPLNKKEIEAIESILKNEFDGETDINSLIDYLYKTVKLISKRKARAGINWLIEQDKLGSKKIGRTTYVKLI